MKCRDIEEKLPAYHEGCTLSSEETSLVEAHLKICPQCSSSLDDLIKTMHLIKELPEIDPPPWFTQKVMARVHDETEKRRGLVKKLFYPFHVKIPIEAFATLMVALLGIYIYQSTQPETGTISRARQARVEQAIPETIAPKETIKEKNVSSDGKTKNDNEKSATTEHLQKTTANADIPSATGIIKEKKQDDTYDRERTRQEAAAPQAPLSRKKEAFSAAGETQPSRSSVPDKQYTELVSVQVTNIQAALKKIDKILGNLGAQPSSMKSHEGRVYMNIQVQPETVNELLSQLKAVGIVKENITNLKLRESDIIRIVITEKNTSAR